MLDVTYWMLNLGAGILLQRWWLIRKRSNYTRLLGMSIDKTMPGVITIAIEYIRLPGLLKFSSKAVVGTTNRVHQSAGSYCCLLNFTEINICAIIRRPPCPLKYSSPFITGIIPCAANNKEPVTTVLLNRKPLRPQNLITYWKHRQSEDGVRLQMSQPGALTKDKTWWNS